MTTQTYPDVEDLVKDWLVGTPVADLVVKGGYVQVYLGMPKGSPIPSVILSRVGGSPSSSGGDIPIDVARISFSVWGSNRSQAKAISKALVAELENLGMKGGYTADSGRLVVAETINWVWLPDEDTARYVVDALVTAVGTTA